MDHPIPEGYIYNNLSLQVGEGLEYLHIALRVVRDDVKGTQCPGV
jgi:hypothetical protein